MATQVLKVVGAPGSTQAGPGLAYAHKAVSLNPNLVGARDIVASQAFAPADFKMAGKASHAGLQPDPTDQEAVFRPMMVVGRNGNSHEVEHLVEQLKTLIANDHIDQQRTDRHRLPESEDTQDAISH